MAKETLTYDQLFAGKVPYVTKVKVAAGTYNRGDLLECKVTTTGTVESTNATVTYALGANYAKPTAKAAIENHYVICAVDVTAEANDEIIVYPQGEFRADQVALGGESTVADNAPVLMTKGIFLVESI